MSLLSPKRILSLWLRRLSTDRLTRQSPELAGQPLVVVATVRSARQITALNDQAARLGLRTGMALTDARAMYPQLVAVDADETMTGRSRSDTGQRAGAGLGLRAGTLRRSEITVAVQVTADAFSGSAKDKIEAAGGSATVSA